MSKNLEMEFKLFLNTNDVIGISNDIISGSNIIVQLYAKKLDNYEERIRLKFNSGKLTDMINTIKIDIEDNNELNQLVRKEYEGDVDLNAVLLFIKNKYKTGIVKKRLDIISKDDIIEDVIIDIVSDKFAILEIEIKDMDIARLIYNVINGKETDNDILELQNYLHYDIIKLLKKGYQEHSAKLNNYNLSKIFGSTNDIIDSYMKFIKEE